MNTMESTQHIKDYLEVLYRRRTALIVFFLSTLLIIAVATFKMKPVYQASVLLMIDGEGQNVLATSGTFELSNQDYYSYKEYFQSQIQIITSDPIIKQVFEDLGLAKNPEFAEKKEPLKELSDIVKVETIHDTRLVKVLVVNADPELAANIANQLAEIYVNRNLFYISRYEILNLLKNEYLKLQGHYTELSKIYKEKHPEMVKVRQEMQDLVNKIEENKANPNEALKKGGVGDTNTLEGLRTNNISIVSKATVPKTPILPKKKLNLIVGLLVGFFGGVILVFLLEYFDDTAHSGSAIERATQWKCIGNVPLVSGKIKTQAPDQRLFVSGPSKGPVAECFRIIRLALSFPSSRSKGNGQESFAVLSLEPQEGKTTFLCNLGTTIAQGGKKVLLVDANFYMPRLHVVFDLSNEKGLSSYLSKPCSLEQIVQKSKIPNLSLITAGQSEGDAAELLTAEKIKEFVSAAEKQFDYVLFDTPSVNLYSDALVIAKAVSGIILIVESGRNSTRQLQGTSQAFTNMGLSVAGAILNKTKYQKRPVYS